MTWRTLYLLPAWTLELESRFISQIVFNNAFDTSFFISLGHEARKVEGPWHRLRISSPSKTSKRLQKNVYSILQLMFRKACQEMPRECWELKLRNRLAHESIGDVYVIKDAKLPNLSLIRDDQSTFGRRLAKGANRFRHVRRIVLSSVVPQSGSNWRSRHSWGSSGDAAPGFVVTMCRKEPSSLSTLETIHLALIKSEGRHVCSWTQIRGMRHDDRPYWA